MAFSNGRATEGSGAGKLGVGTNLVGTFEVGWFTTVLRIFLLLLWCFGLLFAASRAQEFDAARGRPIAPDLDTKSERGLRSTEAAPSEVRSGGARHRLR